MKNLYIHQNDVKVVEIMARWIMVLAILISASAVTVPVLAGEVYQDTDKQTEPSISIVTPEEGNLYVMGAQIIWLPFGWTVVMGPITIRAEVSNVDNAAVDFYIDDELKMTDSMPPYEYPWWGLSFGFHTIKAQISGQNISDTVSIFKIL